ncbi:unnamed protein product [Lathyrus oleraceus]
MKVAMTNEVRLWLWKKKFVAVVIGGGSRREWKKKFRKNLGHPSSPLTKLAAIFAFWKSWFGFRGLPLMRVLPLRFGCSWVLALAAAFAI